MIKEMQKHLDLIEFSLTQAKFETELMNLREYHVTRMRDFQHERLIHLIVTVFVGIAMLLVILAITIFQIMMLLPVAIVLVILFVCYIFHYYRLENGVQHLYELTEKIFLKTN
jgi:Flp pilus assembly protein TadB